MNLRFFNFRLALLTLMLIMGVSNAVSARELDVKFAPQSVQTDKSCKPTAPVRSVTINQGYSANQHSGIDYDGKVGDDVLAADCGEVVYAGREENGNNYDWGYGWHVKIRTNGGDTHLYGHMSRILVKVGDKVTSGQVIGKVGNNGNSTGSHLHHEIRRGKDDYKSAVDPTFFSKQVSQKAPSIGGGDTKKVTEYIRPVDVPITSPFGLRRHPITGEVNSSHTGTDYGAAEGTPIKAPTGGRIDYVRLEANSATGRGYGLLTILVEPNGNEWWFAHQSQALVKAGDEVQPGQVIGRVGSTGGVTASHLHLGFRSKGQFLDAERILKGLPNQPVDYLSKGSLAGLDTFFAGKPGDSFVIVAAGNAEGNRTPDGGKTKSYYGHADPCGCGRWNLGSVSGLGSSPESVDIEWHNKLRAAADKLNEQASLFGTKLTPYELMNGLDVRVQMGDYVYGDYKGAGYVENLAKAKRSGMKGRAAVLQARVYGYQTRDGAWHYSQTAFGDLAGLTQDQTRRMNAIDDVFVSRKVNKDAWEAKSDRQVDTTPPKENNVDRSKPDPDNKTYELRVTNFYNPSTAPSSLPQSKPKGTSDFNPPSSSQPVLQLQTEWGTSGRTTTAASERVSGTGEQVPDAETRNASPSLAGKMIWNVPRKGMKSDGFNKYQMTWEERAAHP